MSKEVKMSPHWDFAQVQKKMVKKARKNISIVRVCLFLSHSDNFMAWWHKRINLFQKKKFLKSFLRPSRISQFFLAISTHYYDQSNKIEWCFNKIAIIFAFKFNIFTKFMHIRDPVKLNFGYLYLLIIVIIS